MAAINDCTHSYPCDCGGPADEARQLRATVTRLRGSVRDLDDLCSQQQELIRTQAEELRALREAA